MGTRLRVKGITFDHWHTLNYARREKGLDKLGHLIFGELTRSKLKLGRKVFLDKMGEVESLMEKNWKRTGRAVTIHKVFDGAAKSLGLALHKEHADKVVEAAISRWIESELVVTYPGTRETLKRLADRYPLGLVSNTPSVRLTYEVLERSGLLQYFRVMSLSAELGWAKPSRRIFLHALEGLGLEPSEVVHVGDVSAEDVVGAKSVGMRAIHVARYEKPSALADERVSSLRQLLRVLPT